jgi:uncharacterized protein (DUF433 family)
MLSVCTEHIEIVEGLGGPKARIVGSRIRVLDVVVWHEQQGMSVAEVVSEFPTITAADVHAALAYYWDNREAIEAYMERERIYVEDARRRIPSVLAEKLKQLHDA